jgi:BirA family biotin operon repressor/biotin-[acetyl-CoA-carboxylase] ligase
MKFEIFKFENVTSTNDIAINLIKNEQKETGCVYAETQTKGRGTHGKEWISDKGNLFGSIFFPLKNNYPPFNEFSTINPLIISDVIKHFCEKKNINLKFPNDIFVNGKKICGILQELIVTNNRKFLIIGIGVNIISNPEINDEYQATNILRESKKKPRISEIIHLIISSYENFFANLTSYNYRKFKKTAQSMSLNTIG